MNNFRRRSSSKKARVLVNQYTLVVYHEPTKITVDSEMPFTIGKAVGSTASLSIIADWYVESRTVYEYSDGSTEYGGISDDKPYSHFVKAEIVHNDFHGTELAIYDYIVDSYIQLTGSSLNTNYYLPVPREGQTVTMDAYVSYGGHQDYDLDTTKHLTITIADTGDNYLVTITPLPQYT